MSSAAATFLLSRKWRRRRCWLSALSRCASSSETPRKLKRRPRALGSEDEVPFIFDSPSIGPSKTSSSSSAAFSMDLGGQDFFIDVQGVGDGMEVQKLKLPKEDPRVHEGPSEASKRQRQESDLDVASAIPRGSMDVTVIPSTAGKAASSELPELASLDRFFRESGNRTEEVQRRDAKAAFALQRYYFADGVNMKVGASGAPPGNAEASRALRTDDGYLTKMGAKHFCVVCCGTGHRAHSCPETRCWICFNTGHNVKDCPMADVKCSKCWRKGHDADGCIFEELKGAAKWWAWKDVRCARCGKLGHPNCQAAEDGSEGNVDADDATKSTTDADKKAQRMAEAITGRRVVLASSEEQASARRGRGRGRGMGRGVNSDGTHGTGRGGSTGEPGRGGRGGTRGRGSGGSWQDGISLDQNWRSHGRGRGGSTEPRRGGRGGTRGRGAGGSWEDSGWDQNWHDSWQERREGPAGPSSKRFEAHDRSTREDLRAKLQKQQGRSGGNSHRKKAHSGGRSDNYGSVPASRIRDQPSRRAQRRAKNAKQEAIRRR